MSVKVFTNVSEKNFETVTLFTFCENSTVKRTLHTLRDIQTF